MRSPAAYPWLVHTLTVDALRTLLPETAGCAVRRYLLPNLSAVNFVIPGLLGEGVASSVRFDPQAKGLGEWLRSRHVDIPVALLPPGGQGTRPEPAAGEHPGGQGPEGGSAAAATGRAP